MKSHIFIGSILVFALALTACGTPATPTVSPTQPPAASPVPVSTDTVIPASTNTAAPAPTTAATQPPVATQPATTQSLSAVTIMTSTKDGVNGPFLVDDTGRSLYIFTTDTQNGGTSACTGNCATNWPALTVTETPVAGDGVDATKLGVITLPDGSMQATYNGWPLYYYAKDVNPGDTNGQGVNGVWYLVAPAGSAITQ